MSLHRIDQRETAIGRTTVPPGGQNIRGDKPTPQTLTSVEGDDGNRLGDDPQEDDAERSVSLQNRIFSPLRTSMGVVRGNRSLQLLFLGNVAVSIQAGLTIPVMPLFLMSKGFSYSGLGFMVALVMVFVLVFQAVGAKYQHLFSRLFVILPLAIVPAITYPLYIVVQTPLGFIAVISLSMGSGLVFSLGYQVFVARLVPKDQFTRSFALFNVGRDMGYASGIVAGGILMSHSFLLAFYFAMLVSISAAFISAWMAMQGTRNEKSVSLGHPNHRLRPHWETSPEVTAIRAGMVEQGRRIHQKIPVPVASSRNALWMTLYALLFSTALFMYPVYFPLFLASNGIPFQWIGGIVAASWLTYIVASLVGAVIADATGRFRFLMLVSLVLSAGLNVVMWMGPLSVLITAWVILGITDGIGRPVSTSMLVSHIDPRAVGTSLTMVQTAWGLARITGPLFFALWVSNFNLQDGLLGVAVLMLLSAFAVSMVQRTTSFRSTHTTVPE